MAGNTSPLPLPDRSNRIIRDYVANEPMLRRWILAVVAAVIVCGALGLCGNTCKVLSRSQSDAVAVGMVRHGDCKFIAPKLSVHGPQHNRGVMMFWGKRALIPRGYDNVYSYFTRNPPVVFDLAVAHFIVVPENIHLVKRIGFFVEPTLDVGSQLLGGYVREIHCGMVTEIYGTYIPS